MNDSHACADTLQPQGPAVVISVTVFRFEYLDRATNALRTSPDFATEAAIRAMGGKLLPDSAREVPADEITFSGIWRSRSGPPL